MTNLSAYDDDALLTTREVAAWLGVTVKMVLRLGVMPVRLPTREYRYLAGDVKAVVRPKGTTVPLSLRRAS